MENLKADIRNRKFKNIYLFYGEEEYLKRHYQKLLINNLLTKEAEIMNLDSFDGKVSSVESISDAFVTLPFMSPYRVIVVKDSNLFFTGRKDDTEKMNDYLKEIPISSVIIFIESKIDKRSKFYKYVAKEGRAVEFKAPYEKDLVKWVKHLFNEHNKTIKDDTALYLLRTVAHNMDNVFKESQKLIDYKKDETEILKSDINEICTKSTETKIFDLIDALALKKTDIALSIYHNLLNMKEHPLMILTMITRQFRLIIQTIKLREMGALNNEIAETLGIRDFVVRECLKQSANFDSETLLVALKECLDIDVDIKTGRKNDKLAVELLILKYAS